ncbi:RAMP superfamily CRISPR-associated protein [Thermus thermophilus]|nr:RAMP superfamily CRISPR-associated protein [Thermus thermophilus]
MASLLGWSKFGAALHCELFGCTGWARKFRLMVLDDKGRVIQNQIQADQTFILRFIPLRPIAPEEWCLLDATLRLIADYGAIGGKTVFKPSDEPTNRQNAFHHRDFGLVQYVQGPDGWRCDKKLEDIRAYVTNSHWRKVPHSYQDNQRKTHDFSWASLQNFWCVKGRYLARQDANTSSFNFVIDRPEPKKNQSSQGDSWLAGIRPRGHEDKPESKKVFSFKEPKNARRTFGFVKNEQNFSQILNKLKTLKDGGNGRQPDGVWESFNPESEFLKGEQILKPGLTRC